MLQLNNRHGQIWVNVASSYLVMNEFVNLDNSPFLTLVPYYSVLKYLLNADHLETLRAYRDARSRAMLRKQDCRRRLPVAKESVDHILCSHFLEHVYPDQAVAIVRDFHRALKSGGTLHVVVPDLGLLIDRYGQSRGTPSAASDFVQKSILSHETQPTLLFRLLECFGSYGLQHRWMYDDHSLRQLLIQNGFTILAENHSPSAAFRKDDGQSVHVLGQKQSSGL